MLQVKVYRDRITRKMGKFKCLHCNVEVTSPIVAQQGICMYCYEKLPHMGQLFHFRNLRVNYHRSGIPPLVPEVKAG